MYDIPFDDPARILYRDEPWPEEAKSYAAMVTMLDRHVGEILDLLREQHDFLYWEYRHQVAVRKGRWKAVKPGPDRPWELYDLDADVSETTDLVDQQPELVREMVALAELGVLGE